MQKIAIFMLSVLVVIFFLCIPADAYFVDVGEDAWYSEAVGYVYDNGLMTGVGEGRFSPSSVFSRAMLAQVLYRMEGRPGVSGNSVYSDVQSDAWYHDAVVWAYGAGVMSGYGSGRFGPNDAVTREQLVVSLYRYDALDGAGDRRLLGLFRDHAQVSAWAEDGMAWAVGHGFVSGNNNRLYPRNVASRAEVAAILMRYLEYESLADERVDELESYIRVQDGTVRFRYVGDVHDIRARIRMGDDVTTYVLSNDGEYVFSFPYGPGHYELVLYENIEGTRYRQVLRQTYDLSEDESDRALTAVSDHYDPVPGIDSLAAGIWDTGRSDYDNAYALYEWIVENVEYDRDRMDVVQPGYMPDLHRVLFERRALCLDYAALMSTMLRYEGIPAQIIVGYYGNQCHAWCEAIIDGGAVRIDPTFGASLYPVRYKYFDMESVTYGRYVEDYRY